MTVTTVRGTGVGSLRLAARHRSQSAIDPAAVHSQLDCDCADATASTVRKPLLPVFTEEVLHRGADVGGFLLAASGFGGLVAALIIATFGFVFKKGVVSLATVITGAVVVLIFAQSHWMPLAFVVIGLFAFSQTTFRTANGTLVQTLVRDDMRARVTSLQRYGKGLVVFASLLVGWFAGVTSAPTALTVVGAVALTLGLVFAATARKVRALE